MNVTFCHWCCQHSDKLYCPIDQSGVTIAGATNIVNVKLLQSPYFFRSLTHTLLTLPPLPTDILYSPQFRLHQETKMAARRTQQSTSTISQKNSGL